MIKQRNFLIWAFAMVMFSFSLLGCGGSKKESGPAAPSAKSAAPAAKEESIVALMNKGDSIGAFSYDYVMEQQQIKMMGKVFKSGEKVRNEAVVNNQKIIMISDAEAKVIYNYSPDQNTAMKITYDPKNEANTPDKYTQGADAARAKVLETTTYGGIKCKVIVVEPKEDKTETKMWIREDYGLPMKVEVTAPEGKMTMEYKNLKVGPQPAELFQVPSGVKIIDASEMMKNSPGKQ